jgi:hypothetical protein
MPRSRMSRSYTSSAPNASVACSETALALVLLNGLIVYSLEQPSSILLPWRNPWNNFQVSGNPCIKIIICTAHGTLACSVSFRYNNPIIIVNTLLSREWYFSVDLFILAYKFKKRCLLFSVTISRGTLSDISRSPRVPRNPGWETLV